MSLPPRTQISDWKSHIARGAGTFMNATAKFYTTAGVLQFTAKARVQPIKSPTDIGNDISWGTKRAVRLQIPLTAIAGQVKKGWIVQLSGDVGDPTLALVSLQVLSAVNSSHAPIRTIECVSELAQTPRVV